MADGLNMSRRIRRTPYTDRVESVGVKGFSVVNHMLLPKAYERSIEHDYWHLREHVQVWDVSCQRQVQIEGEDASELVQLLTPRNLTKAAVGECLYVPIIDERAGLINDPVLLKLSDDKYWLSIADSDVLLWAEGLALGKGLNVQLSEPDVSPLSVQGPKAEDLLVSVFGEEIRDIGFFKFAWVPFKGTRQLIARSGYSRQGGFEIYLQGGHLGADLWDTVWAAGQDFNISPGCPNLIERIEGGLLSYGNEMTRDNNPLEIGFGKYCSLDGSIDYIGRKALENIAQNGPDRKIHGVLFDAPSCPTCSIPWPVKHNEAVVGQITSGIYSPRLKKNIGVALIEKGYWATGLEVSVTLPDGQVRAGQLSNLPFA